MYSINEIKRRYNKLLEKVKTDDYYKIDLTNRVNCYVCQTCRHITKTKDIDAGVTPSMFTCEICGNIAYSSFYKDIATDKKPTFEWFRPSLEQTIKMRKKPALLDHVLNGGLDYRKTK